MRKNLLDRFIRGITSHNRIVIVVLLLSTVVVSMGIPNLKLSPEESSNTLEETKVVEKQEFIQEQYVPDRQRSTPGLNQSEMRRLIRTDRRQVYVHDPDGNVLSKSSLLQTLRFQQRLRRQPRLGDALSRGKTRGVATLVARQAARTENASLSEQITALENSSPDRVETLVSGVLSKQSVADRFMANEYTAGTTKATTRKMTLVLRASPDTKPQAAQTTFTTLGKQIYESARAVEQPDYFTVGRYADETASQKETINTFQLIVPFALASILAVLAFVYRDLVDIVVGFIGVVVSVLWMFGILGWLEVPAYAAIIVGPVLIVGLSVDYGLHVFMRYREQRESAATEKQSAVRDSMFRSLRSVSVALALVTATTAVGFAANLTNDFSVIRGLAIGISAGVIGSFVIFVTLVPALKISVEGLLERVGLDRHKQPLGESRLLAPVLLGGVRLARRVPLVVVLFAVLAASAGAVAWTDLERKGIQEKQGEVAAWKTRLPGPVGWTEPAGYRHEEFVEDRYQSGSRSEYDTAQILIEGPITDPAVLEQIQKATAQLQSSEHLYRGESRPSVQSPVTAIERLRKRTDSVDRAVRKADTDDDTLPDSDLSTVYDAMYEAAPDRMWRVIDRRDSGEYGSLLMVVRLQEETTQDQKATTLQSAAATLEGNTDLDATAVGRSTIIEAESIKTAQSIFRTLLIALAAVLGMLVLVYRIAEGSASLGAVTVFPIVLITAYLIGSMWLLGIPLTFVTALLVSLVVGLGIDYSIHISDRFAQELDTAQTPRQALERAVTGTGGALLGSTLTSVGAFLAILLHPSPRIRSFGLLVVLALALSFLVSVYVLPSILVLWHRHVRGWSKTVSDRVPSRSRSD